jgi:hypothetical protein
MDALQKEAAGPGSREAVEVLMALRAAIDRAR